MLSKVVDKRQFSVRILLNTDHHNTNAMVPPEIAVLFTNFNCKICIKEADKGILLSNESATNEINV